MLPFGAGSGQEHGWGKPSHYYIRSRGPLRSIVVAGLAPAMQKNEPHPFTARVLTARDILLLCWRSSGGRADNFYNVLVLRA